MVSSTTQDRAQNKIYQTFKDVNCVCDWFFIYSVISYCKKIISHYASPSDPMECLITEPPENIWQFLFPYNPRDASGILV